MSLIHLEFICKWSLLLSHFSCVRLFEIPWTAAYQAPPSMGFSRQEYWSGVPLPSLKWSLLVIEIHLSQYGEAQKQPLFFLLLKYQFYYVLSSQYPYLSGPSKTFLHCPFVYLFLYYYQINFCCYVIVVYHYF